jgi:phosphohistidine phosphatase SixA
MADISLPTRATRQPSGAAKLERRGLGNKLVGAWLASNASPLVNAANERKTLASVGSPSFPVLPELGGRHVLVNGSSQYLRETTFLGGNTLPLAIVAKFRADALNSGNHTILALTAGGGTSVIFQLYTVGSILSARHYNTSTTLTSGSISVGKVYTAAVVFRDSTTRELWLDGVLVDSEVTAAGPSPSGINQVDIGASPWAGPGEYFQGAIGVPMVFQEALSASELRALAENPWQVFRAPAQSITATSAAAGNVVAPGVGDLVVAGHSPTITQTAHKTVSPGVGSLFVTGYAPTILRTEHQTVAPGVGSLLLTGYAPTVVRSSGAIVQPGVGELLVTGYAPNIARTAHQIVAPGVGSILVTGHAPTVSQAGAPADPRYARPQSDISAGAWLPSTGSDLYAMIDEVSQDSADYISTSTPSTCEVRLNPVVDPGTSSGQVVRYQVWSPDGDGVIVSLMQGAAVIASWTHASLPATATVFARELSAAECDSITDYANLRFKFEAT